MSAHGKAPTPVPRTMAHQQQMAGTPQAGAAQSQAAAAQPMSQQNLNQIVRELVPYA
ncbi:hypothetical protein KEM55_002496 [Ascosphaera atra]|nr:hypothetical protein KEM55_002496 [Ascosphaera atra]